jgi:hypothetical protein
MPNRLPNHGWLRLEQRANRVSGTVSPHHSALFGRTEDESGEISLGIYFSEHLPVDTPVERVLLDGVLYEGTDLETTGEAAAFNIEDGCVHIHFQAKAHPTRFRFTSTDFADSYDARSFCMKDGWPR